ncbi:sterile alpha motif domain-containing protein 3-like isoform X2 [Tachypleus tridentatus]|uniref:sterile alpha motif domain-containing protein 3-like isoform X2 n=1 Tax=Tachypleus tridentatus TaxID=6853 RepID=UPI003FD3253B
MKTRLHCRKNGDLCKVDLLIDKTLHDRRKLVIDNIPVNELKEHYPFLEPSQAQLLNEFKRLGNDAEKGVSNFLSQYKDSVNSHLQHRNISPENNLLLAFLMKQSSHMPDVTSSIAIIGIPFLLKESESIMVGNEVREPGESSIYIQCGSISHFCDQKFKLYVDGFDICATEDFVEAFTMYVGSFYIFNFAFPTKLKKTFNFVERVVLKLYNESRKITKSEKDADRCVLQLLDLLNVKKHSSGKFVKTFKGWWQVTGT